MALFSGISTAVTSAVSAVKKAGSDLYFGSGGKGGGTGIPNVLSTFSAIGGNAAKGNILTSVPVAAKYQNTLVGNIASIISKPASILAIPVAAASAPAVIANAPAIGAFAGKVATATGSAIVTNPAGAFKTAVGGVVYGSGALVGANILLKSSTAQKAVLNAPSSLSNFGSNIGNLLDNPSLANLTKIGKENPILTGVAAAGAALITGKVVSSAISSITTAQNTRAAQQNTKQEIANTAAIIESNKLVASALPAVAPGQVSQVLVPVAAPGLAPAAVTAPKKAKKKKAKKKAKPKKKAKKKAKPKKKSKKYIKKKAKKRKR